MASGTVGSIWRVNNHLDNHFSASDFLSFPVQSKGHVSVLRSFLFILKHPGVVHQECVAELWEGRLTISLYKGRELSLLYPTEYVALNIIRPGRFFSHLQFYYCATFLDILFLSIIFLLLHLGTFFSFGLTCLFFS